MNKKTGSEWTNEVLSVCFLPGDQVTRNIWSTYAAWEALLFLPNDVSEKKFLRLNFPNMLLKVFVCLFYIWLSWDTQISHF